MKRLYLLKPCPFCGDDDVHVGNDGWPHHVFCLTCGAQTRSTITGLAGEEDAVYKWNKRCSSIMAPATIKCILEDDNE